MSLANPKVIQFLLLLALTGADSHALRHGLNSAQIAGLNFYSFFTLFPGRLHIAVLTKIPKSAIGFGRFILRWFYG